MYQGEIFAYPLYLLKDLIDHGYTLTFMAQDVICKFFPWLKKVLESRPDDMTLQVLSQLKPYLGVMHAKAHSWSCQVSTILTVIKIVMITFCIACFTENLFCPSCCNNIFFNFVSVIKFLA